MACNRTNSIYKQHSEASAESDKMFYEILRRVQITFSWSRWCYFTIAHMSLDNFPLNILKYKLYKPSGIISFISKDRSTLSVVVLSDDYQRKLLQSFWYVYWDHISYFIGITQKWIQGAKGLCPLFLSNIPRSWKRWPPKAAI